MVKIIECVPNFSEGRDIYVIEQLAETARSVPGIMLADYSADADHHRSVFTVIGPPENVGEAAFRLVEKAAAWIDLTRHRGAHPRMGAADVVPFVPLKNADTAECAALARRVAARIAAELGIPAFLYAEAAARENRKNLADIRRSEFEGMAHKLQQPEWTPDYGPRSPHPFAGVTAVGARGPLIAFNVNLATVDVRAAQKIARAVRASGGGFPGCKAIGLRLESKNIAQVSMNIVDYKTAPLRAVYERIESEAARAGLEILNSEIIGCASAEALTEADAARMRLAGFDFGTRVLERYF
jgi:glutamate formiminotransferase